MSITWQEFKVQYDTIKDTASTDCFNSDNPKYVYFDLDLEVFVISNSSRMTETEELYFEIGSYHIQYDEYDNLQYPAWRGYNLLEAYGKYCSIVN